MWIITDKERDNAEMRWLNKSEAPRLRMEDTPNSEVYFGAERGSRSGKGAKTEDTWARRFQEFKQPLSDDIVVYQRFFALAAR